MNSCNLFFIIAVLTAIQAINLNQLQKYKLLFRLRDSSLDLANEVDLLMLAGKRSDVPKEMDIIYVPDYRMIQHMTFSEDDLFIITNYEPFNNVAEVLSPFLSNGDSFFSLLLLVKDEDKYKPIYEKFPAGSIPVFMASREKSERLLQLIRDGKVMNLPLETLIVSSALYKDADSNKKVYRNDRDVNERIKKNPKNSDSESVIPFLQLALIVLTGIFTVSFIISLFLHFSVSHRRRSRSRATLNSASTRQATRSTTVITRTTLNNAALGIPTESRLSAANITDTLDKSAVDELIVEGYRKELFPESNEMCPICIEEYNENEQVKVLPCGHLYHPLCIEPWLTQKSSTCPLCKSDLKDILGDLNCTMGKENDADRISVGESSAPRSPIITNLSNLFTTESNSQAQTSINERETRTRSNI